MAGDTFVVERSERISAPVDAIRGRIVDLHRWQAWSPWEEVDPEMTRNYSGPEAGVGANYSWSGNRKAGAGTMTITDVSDEKVGVDLHFLKPFKSDNKIEFLLRPDGETTEVTWRMTGPKTFMTRVMGIFKSIDAMIGPDFEKGLRNLKADAED